MQFYRRIKLHNLQLSQLIYLYLQIYKSIFRYKIPHIRQKKDY